MAINLNKNKKSLIQAWKDVIDNKNDTNWALFGYEGQTNDLKVISQGSNGVEELKEDLSSGKIMYAFIQIEDPKKSLPKYILLNWQGEGANTLRKGLCANHLRDVESFFTGSHLTVTARNEDEVDRDLIAGKISKSGFDYSFKISRSENAEPIIPVGSTYQRVNPVKEINSRERDQFWLKEEKEEKKRLAEEQERKNVEKIKKEEEDKKREILEALQREEKNKIRDDEIEEHNKLVKVLEEDMKNASIERNLEVCGSIPHRKIDTKLIFEPNSSSNQTKLTPQKPARSSLIKTQNNSNFEKNEEAAGPYTKEDYYTQNIIEEPLSDEEQQFSTIKRSHDPGKKVKLNLESNKNTDVKTTATKKDDTCDHLQHYTDQQFIDEVIYQDFAEGPGLRAKALYDYQAVDDTEITFDPGDIITNINQVDEGWWQGLGPDGSYGLFPANYVELVE